jgi:carboxymethylenebutenolidase
MADISIAAPDGGSFSAYIAEPSATPAAAVLVIQEIFGVNQVMRDLCDSFAAQGYLACCPDLFWRIEPGIQITDKTEAEWKRAFELFGAFDVDKGVDDLKATLQHLRSHSDCNGKVGSVGYCLGGKMAFLMATRSDADCNVSYYGVGLDQLADEVPNITRPLMMHMATKDQFCPPETQEVVKKAVSPNANVTLHIYEGNDHAFAREGGEHYDPEAAGLANERTMAFLKANLA